ncbi:unnamed protein product [Rotaria sp. Silwood2]|nr:unnamed protein product [Rotaria sp. Silwood2]
MVGFDAKDKDNLDTKYLCPVLRDQMEAHYLTEQHQNALINAASQRSPESSQRQTDIVPCRGTATDIHGLTTFNRDRHDRTNTSSENQNALPTLSESTSRVPLFTKSSRRFLETVENAQELLNQVTRSPGSKIDEGQDVSYDGTLAWKIRNVKEKIKDAQSKRQISIYSSSFYSTPGGYKMRGCLYLNGCENALGTHISVFFVLMRGECDTILKFPFCYKITFVLCDQTPTQRHFTQSFLPDVHSSSFQRPQSDMNNPYGFPRFIPLTKILQQGNSYVRDDTLFIKIMVDFGEIQRTSLPHVSSFSSSILIPAPQIIINQGTRRTISEESELAIQNKKHKS